MPELYKVIGYNVYFGAMKTANLFMFILVKGNLHLTLQNSGCFLTEP